MNESYINTLKISVNQITVVLLVDEVRQCSKSITKKLPLLVGECPHEQGASINPGLRGPGSILITEKERFEDFDI